MKSYTDEFSLRIGTAKKKLRFPVHLLKGKDEFSRSCYWLVSCPHEHVNRFMRRQKGVQSDISNEFTVIASGLGHTPSQPVKDKILKEYGIAIDELLS